MITIDITSIPESTISIPYGDTTKVINMTSFQNLSRDAVYWSASEFSETNIGARVDSTDERVFSTPQTIYFKNMHRSIIAKIHARSIVL